MKLKEHLKKTRILFTILQLIKYRKDDDFVRIAKGLRNNPNIIEMHTGKRNYKKPVCLITAGNSKDGLFACVRWMLDGLYFCKTYNFFPVVKFPEFSLYKDCDYSNEENVFDYYFLQQINYKELVAEEFSYIKYSSRNRLLAEEYNGGVTYEYSQQYIEVMSKIWKEYVRFNDKINEEIIYIKNSLLIDNSVLGVHARGTDFRANYNGHPKFIAVEEYIKYIDEKLRNNEYKKVFLATDDLCILEEFKNHYKPANLIYNEKTKRVIGEKGIHTSQENHREIGMDAIIDMAMLSYCGGLISGLSQLSLISRIYKNSRKETYSYDLIINKGINKNRKYFGV